MPASIAWRGRLHERRAYGRAGLIAIALFAALFATGCDDETSSVSGAQTATEATTSMQFSVDPALIGPMRRFEEFNVQIAAPAGWEPLPQEQVAAVAAAAGMGPSQASTDAPATRPAAEFSAEPLGVFASPDREMWLIVSAVSAPDLAVFESTLRAGHNVLAADNYAVEGIDVHQYLVRPPKLVNLKVLISSPGHKDPRRLQLDYVLPEARYNTSGRLLESSLGSMRPIGQTGA